MQRGLGHTLRLWQEEGKGRAQPEPPVGKEFCNGPHCSLLEERNPPSGTMGEKWEERGGTELNGGNPLHSWEVTLPEGDRGLLTEGQPLHISTAYSVGKPQPCAEVSHSLDHPGLWALGPLPPQTGSERQEGRVWSRKIPIRFCNAIINVCGVECLRIQASSMVGEYLPIKMRSCPHSPNCLGSIKNGDFPAGLGV